MIVNKVVELYKVVVKLWSVTIVLLGNLFGNRMDNGFSLYLILASFFAIVLKQLNFNIQFR